ncbi:MULTISPECIES: hypothetical protein [Actinomycetes]|uniref:hypothetical protein n=1 Tax=Actinomycetes TaxID=1760 RepID=UPI0002E99524|nr:MULTISPECIES: hypothetical protein [Actinomycetes]
MRVSLAVTGLVLLLAGCAAETPAAAPSSAPPSSSAPASSSPPASSAPVAKDLTKYLPSEEQLSAAGARRQQDRLPYVVGPNTPLRLVRACDADQPWDSAAYNGAQAISVTDKAQVHQLLAQYQGYSGEQVVSGLGKALDCGKAVVEGEQLAVKTRFSVPGVADPQLGFCGQFRSVRVAACVLVLAHGDRALAVTSIGWRANIAEHQAELKRLAPAFVAAFDQV